MSKAPRRKSKRPVSMRPRADTFPRASEVKVIKADGSIEVVPALSRKGLDRVTKDRGSLSNNQKLTIRKRDRDTCRYCGKYCNDSIRQFDHVLPVVDGGPTTVHNMVVSCMDCNQKKGTNHWKPVPLNKHRSNLRY